MPRLIEGVSDLASNFQEGKEAVGLKKLPEIFDGIQWIIEALTELKKVCIDLQFSEEDITKVFREFEGALQIRDYVLIGDLLDYEIKPYLINWLENIESLRRVQLDEMGIM